MSIRKNELDKVLQHLEKAVEAYPEYSEAYNNMGVIHLKMGKRAEAEKVFSRAVEADPSFFRASYRLGYVYLERKEYPLALEAFQQFLRTNQGGMRAVSRESFNNWKHHCRKPGRTVPGRQH